MTNRLNDSMTDLDNFLTNYPHNCAVDLEPILNQLRQDIKNAEKALRFAVKWAQPVLLEKNMDTYTVEQRVKQILRGVK